MIDKIGVLRWIRNRVEQIFEIVGSILRLTETGGSLTADGTEQTVIIIDTPLGVFDPRKVKIDMSNMTWGDTTILRWYERLQSGGALILKDEDRFEGPQDTLPDSPITNIELEPNRFGIQITLEQIAGVNRIYPWEFLYKV